MDIETESPAATGPGEPQAPADNVVELATANARAAVRGDVKAIAELCALAGMPERLGEFIAAEKTPEQVRAALLEARAARSEATRIDPAHAPGAASQASPVVEQCRRIAARQRAAHGLPAA